MEPDKEKSVDIDDSFVSSNVTEYEHSAKKLSTDEVEKLKSDVVLVSKFHQNKFEMEAKKNWDKFYKRNSTNFFKDRHWTKREFTELVGQLDEGRRNLLEVGCGVGNFIWPLVGEDTQFFVYACDFSPRAVEFVRNNSLYDESKCFVFEADVTQSFDDGNPLGPIKRNLPKGVQIDVVSLIFVLSSIHPDKMKTVISNIYEVLRPGGVVLFRDYGLYDHAMLRFRPGHRLGDNFYVRQDGTRAYYFSLGTVTTMFVCR